MNWAEAGRLAVMGCVGYWLRGVLPRVWDWIGGGSEIDTM